MKLFQATITDAHGRKVPLTTRTRDSRSRTFWSLASGSLFWINLAHARLVFLWITLLQTLAVAFVLAMLYITTRKALPSPEALAIANRAVLVNASIVTAPALLAAAITALLFFYRSQLDRRAILQALGRDRCPSCWYNLAGTPAPEGIRLCPECGAAWKLPG